MGTLFLESVDPSSTIVSLDKKEGKVAPSTKEMEIHAMEENHSNSEDLDTRQAIQENSSPFPTPYSPISNFGDDFEPSNFMFKDIENHGEKIKEPEDTMKQTKPLSQLGNEEENYLSYLEDCFNGKNPMEWVNFSTPSFTFKHQDSAIREENTQEKHLPHKIHLELRFEELNIPSFKLK